MCPKEYINPSNQKGKSINPDLRRKNDDHQTEKVNHHQIRKKDHPKNKTSTKEPEEIDEDGFILVTMKHATRGPIQQPQQPNQDAPSDEDENEDDEEKDEEEKKESEGQEDDSSER
jgi:hypothetical protein